MIEAVSGNPVLDPKTDKAAKSRRHGCQSGLDITAAGA
jgi:hypothetical protein